MEDALDNKSTKPFSPEMAVVLDHLEEGIIILDANRHVLFRSRKCELQFGLSGTASSLAEIAPAEHQADWHRAVDLALIEGTFCTVVAGVNDAFIRLHINVQTDGNIVVSIRAADPPVTHDDVLGAYERVLAKYNIGLWKIHVPSGELWWSDQCYELLNLERGPICTSAYMKDLSEQDRNRISAHINLALSKKGQYAPTFQINHEDGVRHIQDRAAVLQRAEDGTPISFVGATVDRTQIVDLEAQCTRMKNQIDEADALRQTGRLTGAVAHDMNNVITVILGNAELLRFQGLEAEADQLITNIHTAALHAGALSSRMLDFVRDLPLALASVDAVQILEESLPMLRALVGEKAELTLENLPAHALIMGDRHRLEQALYNLVLNAGQAVGANGQIRLYLDVEDDVGSFCIADNGPGSDDSVRDQIFSPFFSTKETGVGLGLSSVKRIVDQHNGRIELSTPPDGGTVFTITVPRSFAEPVTRAAAVVDTEAEYRRVWLVEDQLLVRVVTEQLLSQAGYQVRAFASPDRLLQALAEGEQPPDLVLSDVMMPTMSGPELRQSLVDQWPDVRFVFMTGYADDLLGPFSDVLDSGSLLHKPFHRTELLRAIAQSFRI